MNTSFKVVFNKARGALMVVNEVTSSVQKHSGAIGTKTLMVVGIAGVMCGNAQADYKYEQQWSSSQTPDHIAVNATVDETRLSRDGYVGCGLFVSRVKAKQQNNASVHYDVISSKTPTENENQVRGIYVMGTSPVDATFGGDTLTVNTKTDFLGTGNNSIIGLDIDTRKVFKDPSKDYYQPTLANIQVKAKATDISVESVSVAGKAVYGIQNLGQLSMTGDVVNVKVKSATVREGENQYSETIGVLTAAGGVITTGPDTALNIRAENTGTVASTQSSKSPQSRTGSSPVSGFRIDAGGQATVGGTTTIDVLAVGGDATGIGIADTSYQEKSGIVSGKTKATFKDVVVTAYSKTGNTWGIQSYVNEEQHTRTSPLLTITGNTTLVASTDTGHAYGIGIYSGDEVLLSGDTTVKATAKDPQGKAYSIYSEAGTLTFNGTNVALTGDAKVNGTVNLTGTGGAASLDGKLTGKGVLNITNNFSATGDLSGFTGTVNLQNGDTTLVAANKNLGGTVNLTGGSLDVTAAALGTTVLNGGTLKAKSSQVFTGTATNVLIDTDATKVKGDATNLVTGLTATAGILNVTDQGFYTTKSVEAMSDALAGGSASLVLTNAQLFKKADETATLLDNVIQSTENAVVAVTPTQGAADVTVKNAGAQSLTVKDNATTNPAVVTEVTFKSGATGTGATENTLTLVGTTSGEVPLVTNATGAAVDKVTVDSGLTLQVGLASSLSSEPEPTAGSLETLVLKGDLNIVNATLGVKKLVGEAGTVVAVGNDGDRGTLRVNVLDLKKDSVIFLDPAWSGDAKLDVIGNASHLEVSNAADSTLAGNVVVGQNAMVAYGTSVDRAAEGFGRLGMTWGEKDATAALTLGHTMDVTKGSVAVDGLRTGHYGTVAQTGTVELHGNAVLLIDQQGIGDKAIDGKLVVKPTTESAPDLAQVGVYNATEGEFTLATGGVELPAGKTLTIVTDSVFVDAALDDNKVILDVNEAKLGGALASMGVQAMAYRADNLLAQAVTDRTAMGAAGEGVSWWADVGGERYEADKLGNGAEFETDVAYGVFGADVGLTPAMRAGVALQVAQGDVKSPNYGLKNDMDAFGLAVYGSVDLTDATKLVGEFAWTKSSNDITSSLRDLDNDIDADVMSMALRAQTTLTSGPVTLVPSAGVRLSRLSTDGFNVGGIRLADEDQTLVQLPLSLTVTTQPIEASGWQWMPYAKATFAPTFGDDELEVLGDKQTVIDNLPVQGDFGAVFRKGAFEWKGTLTTGFGQDGARSFGGKLGMSLSF